MNDNAQALERFAPGTAAVPPAPVDQIHDACDCLKKACAIRVPAANELALFVPEGCGPETVYWKDAIVDLAGAHIRFRLSQGERPLLDEYLAIAAGHADAQSELRGLFRNLVGLFHHELDVRILYPLYPPMSGAQSIVYAAREQASGDGHEPDIVVKVLHPDLIGDNSSMARFAQEVELLTRARSRTHVVVQVLRAGFLTYSPDGLVRAPAYVMERCKSTLEEELSNYRGEKAIGLMARIASALQKLHDRGIVLRDLKPANVLFRRTDEGDVPVIADLGQAKDLDRFGGITRDKRWVRGTPGYRSAHAARGERHLDPDAEKADDVLAIGAILYQLLHPDQRNLADREAELNDPVRVQVIVDQGLCTASDSVRDLIVRCLAPDPKLRPAAGDVAEHLRREASAPRSPRQPRTRGRSYRRIAASIGACAALFLLVLALAAAAWPTLPRHIDTRISEAQIVLVYRVSPDQSPQQIDEIYQKHLDEDTARAFDQAGVAEEDRQRLVNRRSVDFLTGHNNELVAFTFSR